jgi:hypothetical protein
MVVLGSWWSILACEFRLRSLRLRFINSPFIHSSLTASIILAVTYGYDVNTQQDRFLTLARNVTRELSNCLVPGAYLVDTLPFRTYDAFPLYYSKSYTKLADKIPRLCSEVSAVVDARFWLQTRSSSYASGTSAAHG